MVSQWVHVGGAYKCGLPEFEFWLPPYWRTLGKVVIIFKIVIYEFLAVLGPCCCAWAFSSCGERRLLSSCRELVSYCGGFSCCKARALECGLWQLWRVNLLVPWHVESSWTRGLTWVPCFADKFLTLDGQESLVLIILYYQFFICKMRIIKVINLESLHEN